MERREIFINYMCRYIRLAILLLWMVITVSCSNKSLVVSDVTYQSIRTYFAKPEELPSEATIAVEYFIDPSGTILSVVYNLTDEIITIDQTKSFLVNTKGESVSYYDPTIKSTTTGDLESSTSGTSFNLGAIANAFGIGGPLGSLMGGTTLSGSSTAGSFSSNTVTVVDQPKISIGPHGRIVMSKQFKIYNVGKGALKAKTESNFIDSNFSQSPLHFSVTVCYELNGKDNIEKLTTDFYVNTNLCKNVTKGKVSDAFTAIYQAKPDALVEPAYIICLSTNMEELDVSYYDVTMDPMKIVTNYAHGSLIDYK